MKNRAIILIAIACLVLPAVAGAQVTNGDFEAGNTSGWIENEAGGGSGVFATTGWSGITPAGGSWYGSVNGNSPTVVNSITQTFNANAGDTLSLEVLYDCNDAPGFADPGDCSLTGPGAPGTFFSETCNSVPGDTGWVPFSFPLSGGSYTLTCRARNESDTVGDPQVGVDNVVLQQGGGGGGDCDLTPVLNALNALESKADAAEGKLDSLEAKGDAAEGKLDSLESKADAAQAQLDALAQELEDTQNLLAEVIRLLVTPQGQRASDACGEMDPTVFPNGKYAPPCGQ